MNIGSCENTSTIGAVSILAATSRRPHDGEMPHVPFGVPKVVAAFDGSTAQAITHSGSLTHLLSASSFLQLIQGSSPTYTKPVLPFGQGGPSTFNLILGVLSWLSMHRLNESISSSTKCAPHHSHKQIDAFAYVCVDIIRFIQRLITWLGGYNGSNNSTSTYFRLALLQ